MDNNRRRILLVVDGSYQAYEAVNYVSGIVPPSGSEIVLLHVMSKVPEAFWDLEKDPLWQQKVQTVRGWEIQQEKKINDFMQRARQVFLDAGFPDSAVKADLRERKDGIARDIGAESHCGYDTVILGRRGLSTIQDLSLGGVASKVVLKVTDLAVWLVGGRPDSGGIIIGIDASEGSMRAVDHVARMTDSLAKKILLLHVIRKIADLPEDIEGSAIEEFQKMRMEKAEQEIEPVMAKARLMLQDRGLKSGDISVKIVKNASTRAGTIIEEAKAGGYGTIVVGRRGLSTVQEFDMGRVSSKLVQASKDRALWVVG